MFIWLNQVNRDPQLPASAFKVAFEIVQHVHKGTDTAWPGTDKIAINIAMSKATAIDMVRRLAQRGHVDIELGRKGSGHSNRYRLVFKPQGEQLETRKVRKRTRKGQPASGKDQSGDLSEETGKGHPSDAKGQPAEIKGQPADMNHLGTTSITMKRVGEANPSTDSLSEDRAKAVTVTRGQGFSLFCLCYPKDFRGDDREAALAAFELALDAGHTPEELQMAASDVGKAYRRGESIPNLIHFLNSYSGRPVSPFHRTETDHAKQ